MLGMSSNTIYTRRSNHHVFYIQNISISIRHSTMPTNYNARNTCLVYWVTVSLGAAHNVAVLARFVVIGTRSAWNFGIDCISSIAALAGGDVELAVCVARSTVVNLVARIAMFVGAFIAFSLITNLATI